ncbi:MAG: hypothetical protein PHF86_13180 [Candidatus Nanoarchaeia archaeon]|nr:hypothetical protein [Candidatus Nanoarchaeia archaeon]
MKVRLGFVSNSSSSSFVLVADKKDFDEAIVKLHPSIQHVIGRTKTVNFNGKDIICILDHESTEDVCFQDIFEDYESHKFINQEGIEVVLTEEEMDDWNTIEDIVYMRENALRLLSVEIKKMQKDCVFESLSC